MRLQYFAASRGVTRSLFGSCGTGMRVTRALQPPQIAFARSPPIYEMASPDYQPSTVNKELPRDADPYRRRRCGGRYVAKSKLDVAGGEIGNDVRLAAIAQRRVDR